MEQKSILRRFTDRMYGGLNMSWPAVILFAVATALLTAVFMIFPVFLNTSFMRVGETFEAWIFFAVIIMANCKSPLDSMLKTFVFFLISQPLIYLLQVPFSYMGWGLFGYYQTWFYWTLATIPMSFIGWFIKKKNWWSVLIFAPVLCFLGLTAHEAALGCIKEFPHYLVTAIFCVLQILLYVYVFLPKIAGKLVGLAVPVIFMIVMLFVVPKPDMQIVQQLPDAQTLTAEATATVEDPSLTDAQVTDYEYGCVMFTVHKPGETTLTVTDGDKTYTYDLVITVEGNYTDLQLTPTK